MNILIVEDEININDIIVKTLRKNNYTVDTSFDGQEALELLTIKEYDLIITDINMPNMDGFTLIRTIRDKSINTPVIFLSAKDHIDDKIMGLDLGASDYIVKPFIFDELLARIRVITRKQTSSQSNILSISNLTLNIKTHEVKRDNNLITLTSKEYSLLKYMLLNKDIVLKRESIENSICDINYDGASNMVDVYIRYLRKKIDDNYDNKLIHTIRGFGYVLKESDK